MDGLLLQRTRYVLRTRVRRVQSCPSVLFVSACNHLMQWVEHHPIMSSVVASLRKEPGEFREHIAQTLREAPQNLQRSYTPGFYQARNQQEHAALCLELVHAVAGLDNVGIEPNVQQFIVICLGEYLNKNPHMGPDEAIKVIRDVAVDGLYEFLDEQIDARNVLYTVLLKYKQRSEWFYRNRLREIAANGLE